MGSGGAANERWSEATIRLHWLGALLILAALAVGWSAEHLASRDDQPLLYEIHFSMGLLALAIMLARIVCRLIHRRPDRSHQPLPARFAASAVHLLLYLATFGALLSGLVNFLFLGPVRVFGFLTVPRMFDPEADEWLRALSWYAHIYCWWALAALVLLHAAAALFHHFVRRDRTLRDFLPGGR